MQDKMERLLNQIGMNKDYLENASIDKIIVYEKNNLWEFIISNDKVLPVYIYDELCKTYVNAEIIDAHGGLIMPGFINAHHHIYSALARGLSLPGPAPTNFGEILEGLWFYLTAFC